MDERNSDALEEEREDLGPLMEEYKPHLGGTVEAVIYKVRSGTKIKTDAAVRDLNRLSTGGLIRFVDTNPPKSAYRYLLSLYCAWFWAVVGLILVTAFSIYLLPQSYPLNLLRAGASMVFIFIVPGYALVEALYPKSEDLERLERFAISVGLSLALVPLTGYVLNYTPWGIRLGDTFLSLSVLSVAMCLLAVYRKYINWRLLMRLYR